MSKDSILDYSTTPSENQDINGISILGTAKPSNLDDGMRAEMAHIAKDLVTRRSVKDTAYTAVKTDLNQLLEFSAEATLTTAAAATLTDGWQCKVYAQGGAVTINPNGSETVNGEEFLFLQVGKSGILSVNNGNFRFEAFGGERVAFRVHKNGTNQSQSAGTYKVTWSTKQFDVGGYFDTSTGRYTPAAGSYRLSVSCCFRGDNGGQTAGTFRIELRKNGVTIAMGTAYRNASNASAIPVITDVVEANGTDYFEVFAMGDTNSTAFVITGAASETWFCGHAI